MSDQCGPIDAAVSDLVPQAVRYRERLGNVVVIGVTGSCGKTTTKDLTAAVLATRFAGSKSEDTKNCGPDVAATVLAAQRDDDFLVQELGAWGPGTLDAGISLARPDIAVVTNIRNDHYSSFHGPLGAQSEKGKLVASLPPSGTAVLNWDDPLVGELSSLTAAPTLSFGRDRDAALRAWDVTARWPERLSFSARHGRETTRVQTRLLGEHLLGSVLAALGVAVVFGMALDEAGAALASVEPTFRRMSPSAHPDGVTFIRDDWKAPADSLPETLAFMSSADARRKLAVLGSISDYPGRSRRTYSQIAWHAMIALDTVIFVGDRAVDLWGRQDDPSSAVQEAIRERVLRGTTDLGPVQRESNPAGLGTMFVFDAVRDAHEFLSGLLEPGDLVLVKGSGPADHLERVILGRAQPIGCWEHRCGRLHPCDMCDLRNGSRAARLDVCR
jgi:UDP-N-acetylmuramyl pentapeptide synthase